MFVKFYKETKMFYLFLRFPIVYFVYKIQEVMNEKIYIYSVVHCRNSYCMRF